MAVTGLELNGDKAELNQVYEIEARLPSPIADMPPFNVEGTDEDDEETIVVAKKRQIKDTATSQKKSKKFKSGDISKKPRSLLSTSVKKLTKE